jgi:hypothetical protein
MTLYRIPTQPYPVTTQRVELDGVQYTMRLLWSERGQAWHLDLGDVENTPILSGLRLVTGFPLLYRFHYLAVPPGELYFVDLRGLAGKPTLEDMGVRFQLFYDAVLT